MSEYLVVIDMQNDFINGALGTAEAVSILPGVRDRIATFTGELLFTRDTHDLNYLATAEGKKLPVTHCIKGTPGWEIHPSLAPFTHAIIDKPTFGSLELAQRLKRVPNLERVTLIGLCTDICVISNALILKAAIPEIPVVVDSAYCAGVSPQSHLLALEAMRLCQVQII